MTKKIGNAIIIKRLQNRFSLTDLEPEILAMGEKVVPVTNADAACKKLKEMNGTTSVTAVGFYDILNCPAGKRYEIIAAAGFLSTGTYTLLRMVMTAPSGNYVTVKAQSSANNIYWQPTVPTYLDKAWRLSVYVDTYAVTGNLNYYVFILESEGDNE